MDYKDKYETQPAGEVLKGQMFSSAKGVLEAMVDYGEMDHALELRYMARITKALGEFDFDGEDKLEVAKALDYGPATSDVAELTQGGALVGQSLKRKVKDMTVGREEAVKECVKAVMEKSWRPWAAGTRVDVDDIGFAFAAYMKDNFYLDDAEAAAMGLRVLEELNAAIRGV